MNNKIFIGMGIVLAIGIAFLIINKDTSDITGDALSADFCSEEGCPLHDLKEFNLEASKFEYTPNIIKVNTGERVRINVDNSDTLHGIRIPELDVEGMEYIEFTAEEKGEFTWYCNNYCGGGHKEMSGTLIID